MKIFTLDSKINMNSALVSAITCPITHDIMTDPVQGSDGKTYERQAIIRWLQSHGTSPETRAIMNISSLKDNYAIKYLIEEYNKNGGANITPELESPVIIDDFETQTPFIDFKTSYFEGEKNGNQFLAFNIFENLDIDNYKIYNDIVLIIDRSGSMSQSVTSKDENGSLIEGGFSAQDIVNHAAKTVVNTLNDNDRITIIAFDNMIEIVGNVFLCTNETNKKKICTNIDRITPRNQTDIWRALKKGFDCIRQRIDKSRNPMIMILTDGAPNVSPARGEVETLKREKKESNINSPIYTFGFGYSLKKELLYQMSKHGDGAFGHISDGGMIATVFNNFIGTIMSTICINFKLVFKFKDAKLMNILINIDDPVKGDFTYLVEDSTIKINICTMQLQQYKSILLNLKTSINNYLNDISCYLIYENKNETIQTEEINLTNVNKNSESSNNINNFNDYYRYEMISLIKTASDLRYTNCDPQSTINGFISKLKDDKDIEKEFQNNMIESLTDQISKSVSMKVGEQSYFNKWGEFYIEQLIRALNQQIKPNFKDNVCFQFGGEYFNNIVDKSSDIFDNMPPPKPSNIQITNSLSYSSSYRSIGNYSYQPPVNMCNFNNRDGGCFAGHCLVRLQDNKLKQIKDLVKNDVIISFDPKNNYKEVTTKVKGLIKINYKYQKQLIKFIKTNLEITNYHPIYCEENNEWIFPIDKTYDSVELTEENCVYNIVLENYHIIEVNSVKCITLGHNYEFDVLSHPYFGSNKVINDLNSDQNFANNGFIEIDETKITRDPESTLINCIV